jgi:mannobiose 2-epimerase
MRTLGIVPLAFAAVSCASAEGPPASRLSDADGASRLLERILVENIIPFWYPKVLDTENGGYRLHHDRRGQWQGPAPKFLVTQARTVWFFARLAGTPYGEEKHLLAARHGYEFLRNRLWDKEYGGFFWAMDATGTKPTMPDKHLYGQSFGLYAVSEFARAARDAEAAAFAREIFGLLERRAHDAEYGGYREAFRRTWKPLAEDAVSYMRTSPGVKLMNTHLHLMEALTSYYRATEDPAARERLLELIAIQSNAVVRKDVGACTDRYARTWKPFRGPQYDRVSYGHDIENVWLLIEACGAAGRPTGPYQDLFETLFRYTFRHGYDFAEGGFYDSGPIGKSADRRGKVWWVQAEGLVSALRMYKLTGDPRYEKCFDLTLAWIDRHQADWEHGDWFADVSPYGKPSGAKAGAWKSPYHNGRAVIRCLELLAEPAGASVPR